MTSSFNEENFIRKLDGVLPTQDSIQSIALWIIHHKNHHELITKLWLDRVKCMQTPKQVLTLYFLANDIIQTCKRKNAKIFQESFKEPVLDGVKYACDESIRFSIQRIFNVWLDRNVYDKEYIDKLTAELNKNSLKEGEETPAKKQKQQQNQSQNDSSPEDIHVDPKIQKLIAEFQPNKLCENIQKFVQVEKENLTRKSCIETSRLLEINLEHVRQYRDKTQCEKFMNEFDNSCVKLDEFIRNLETQSNERESLVNLLEQSEIFYNAQFKDAKIIVNAYRSFAQKVEALKGKLEETLMTMNKRPYDVKLDNLDMELSDDDADKSPIVPLSARIKYQSSHDSTGNTRLKSVVSPVKPHVPSSSSSGIKTHLDPRQNKHSNNTNSKDLDFRINANDQSNKNPLDFLTKIINKSTSTASTTSSTLVASHANTNLTLINSLQNYIEKSHQQQQPSRKNSTENYYDPREYNYDGYYDQIADDNHSNLKRSRSNPFLSGTRSSSSQQQQREGTPTKDEKYQNPAPPPPPPLPIPQNTQTIYAPNQAYNPFAMIPSSPLTHHDPMLSGIAYYPTTTHNAPPQPPSSQFVPYQPLPSHVPPLHHHNPFTAHGTDEYRNDSKRRYSDNNSNSNSRSQQSRQNFTSPHKPHPYHQHPQQQQQQKFNKIPTVSSQRDRYDENPNGNHHYGRSNSRY